MGLFEHFPYTNFHGLNLDWMLKTIKQLVDDVDALKTWRGNWSVTKHYNWTRTDEDHSGGSLVSSKSENCWIRSIDYRITGRIVEYEMVFYPDPDGSFPMTGQEITIDLPGWIYGYPDTFQLYMFDTATGKPVYQADYNWRHTDDGKLRIWVREPERHQYSVHGWIVLAEAINDMAISQPNE